MYQNEMLYVARARQEELQREVARAKLIRAPRAPRYSMLVIVAVLVDFLRRAQG